MWNADYCKDVSGICQQSIVHCVNSYCPLALIISTNVKALFPKAVHIGEDWGGLVA